MTPSQRFSEILQIRTVSSDSPENEDSEVFRRFPELLEELYPAAHKAMVRELIGDRGILFRWDGANPGLMPVLGMAHYDVVPPGNPDAWKRPPFSGEIEDGFIYGRGALDDKGMLAAWMEAAERLALSGFKPKRTLYLAFGGDEESIGNRGGRVIARELGGRGLRFAFILDEGGAVVTDQFTAFTKRPVALIGSAEKGYLTLSLSAEGMSGHASSPPKHSAIGRLSAALSMLEKNPFPRRLTRVPAEMLMAVGRATPGIKGFLLRHPRFFKAVLLQSLGASPGMAGMIRTTTALTIVKGGHKENVMPDSAAGTVNLRILPGESVSTVIRRVKKIASRAVDGGLSIREVNGAVFEPVPASSTTDVHWHLLRRLVEETWPDAIVAPYLMTATTDSRWFRDLSDNIYRFIPMEIGAGELAGVHSSDEFVSLAAWEKSVDFLEKVISSE